MVAVAYSGGRDSTALLHATLAATAPLGTAVVALHVHHGLNADADAWLEHCRAWCEQQAGQGARLRFVAYRVEKRPPPGASVEAWARAERYAALAQMARRARAPLVLLAHHRRDQAETFLLQALRGAGVPGLAGMPRLVHRDGIHWGRPWLERPREAIEAYVRKHRLEHVEDGSNADPRFARNRLRQAVWPTLTTAFPEAEQTLAMAADWARDASEALAELAAQDLATVADGEALRVDAWLALSRARRVNVLRAWLARSLRLSPPASILTRLLDELPGARDARWPVGAAMIGVHRGRLMPLTPRAPAADSLEISIRRAGRHVVKSWGGRFDVVRVERGGVSFERLARLELRSRVGAERFQAGPGRPARSLKKQFQDAGVAPWQREGPLVFSGDRLVYVPGLGLDARVIAAAGEPQATLQWVPEPR